MQVLTIKSWASRSLTSWSIWVLEGSRFVVKAWSAWAPGLETQTDWFAWAGASTPDIDARGAAPVVLPVTLRRRISPIGQRMMAACLACGDGASVGRYVFASRHGEMTRTLSIMQSLAAQEQPSPADFSLSVHNALAGLLSIHAQNRAGHTALAAGPDTFGYALVEAVGWLCERPEDSVLICYGDDALPSPYGHFDEGSDGLPRVVALLLRAPVQGSGSLALTTYPNHQIQGDTIAAPTLPSEFLRFYLGGLPTHQVPGASRIWRWDRVG
jgi:hypothetical protein